MKGTLKRVMSGVLSVITIASAVAQPITAYAAEPEKAASSFEAQYPELETVKDKLAEDEILIANDYSIDYGSDFDIKVDFSGIEGINDAKVKVELYEAKNEAGDNFDTYQADTYKAVYKVEPVSGNPSYRISRNVTVKEPETEQLTEPNTSENTVGEGNAGETEDSGNAEEDADAEGQTEIVTDLAEEEEVTTDEESGLTVSEVMDQAEDSGIDLYSMEEGEVVTFMAREASSRSTKKVTVTRGNCYHYSDYGYGSYLTYQYTVKFGNVSATAYCIQPEKSSPGTGTYDITKLSDGKKLAKVCYYGTKAAGDEGFFTEENGYGNLSAGARFILVHLAASYDLTSLQREANRYFGYTAKRTLDMLQELYEEKLITYPRTDSQFVTEDMKDSVEELVGKMPVLLPFVDYGQLGHDIKRVINNAKVSDHHAILPTKEAVEKGIADLPADKKNLMMLICQQLVQATGEEYLYEQTDITVKCQEHDFKARGKISVQMGFKEVEKAFKQLCVKAEPVEGKEKETSIPAGYEEGMRLFPVKAEKTTHYTSPPKPFNEDTLLAAMETAGNKEFDSETEKKGLGTPATRASIIEKLVSSGYAQRKGKQILPSIEGKELVKVMPEYLKSAVMTAEWENQLLMMEKGQITDTQFMGEITSLVRKILEVCREIPEEERRRFQTAREVIGKCPVCGCDVFEGKQNFYCSNRQCDFALWKENRFLGSMEKNLDKKMARELLDKACTHVKGLYSKKKDMKFDADLLLTLEDGKPRFHLEFPKKKKK